MLEYQNQLKLKTESETKLKEAFEAEKSAKEALAAKEHLRKVEAAKKFREDVSEEMSDEYLDAVVDTFEYTRKNQTNPINAPKPPSIGEKKEIKDYRFYI